MVLRGDELLRALDAAPFADRDAWVDRALGFTPPADDMASLPQGTVPYVPCPVDAIVRAVREAPLGPHDVLVDLGSGAGRVAILAHLLTGARAIGVELQAHLAEEARAHAARLELPHVSFVHGDASDAALAHAQLAHGTVFFIYSSFAPAPLARVLAWLQQLATTKKITLCAVDFDVHEQSWLRARPSSSPALVLYDSA
jgi:precorrin-6B methylase 2